MSISTCLPCLLCFVTNDFLYALWSLYIYRQASLNMCLKGQPHVDVYEALYEMSKITLRWHLASVPYVSECVYFLAYYP